MDTATADAGVARYLNADVTLVRGGNHTPNPADSTIGAVGRGWQAEIGTTGGAG